MLLVSENEMKRAMRTFYDTTGHLAEGAAVAALAGALKIRDQLAGRKVCLLITGANIDRTLRDEILQETA